MPPSTTVLAPAAPAPVAQDAAETDLLMGVALQLFEHGQTTERTVEATARLGAALGLQASLLPRWSDLTVRIETESGARCTAAAAAPVGVDMGKVVAVIGVVEDVCAGRIAPGAAPGTLRAAARLPPVSLARFALLAAAGAAALGVIFGASDPLGLLMIALTAGIGACLRRWLEGVSRNRFVQPLCAALLAGIVGAAALRMPLGAAQALVAVCPCMILVPGPHLLNGTLDLARARIELGMARIAYAGTTILAICTGLLAGLALGGAELPIAAASPPAPLAADVLAAGVAVAAYGTFFAMPWRMLPIPVAIGMLAHASRWVTITWLGGSVATGAFVACLLVGIIVTPIADRLRLPFAAFAFASVVSLIPGVFLFRMAGGLVALVAQGEHAAPALLLDVVADGAGALLIMLAMAFGLILPKMLIEHAFPELVAGPRRGGC
jgi:uncharacterized membrane protein YjjP (DUF1212 family)